MIHVGDCVTVMRTLPADSVDAVCTDPPYGIGFMGKTWDAFDQNAVEASWSGKGRNHTSERNPNASTPGGRSTTRTGFRETNPRCGTCGRVTKGRDTAKGFKVCHCENPVLIGTPNRDAQRFQAWCEAWGTEALRVTKPGGYLLAFGGTRTHHRLVCGLEDAGWIIRDELTWIYASGFPKGKANLKPAHEPIVLARKPGPLRPLGIDAGRISHEGEPVIIRATEQPADLGTLSQGARPVGEIASANPQGRWPSNVLLDPDSAALFDEPNPEVVGSGATASTGGQPTDERGTGGIWHDGNGVPAGPQYGDTGGYSRFFLVPKSSRADREPVVRGTLEAREADHAYGDGLNSATKVRTPEQAVNGVQRAARENLHPTCKPTDLMRHLIRLVTPSGGTVLDPFAGSGSTLIAAELEGFPWIGIEQSPEYVAIAEARLNGTQRGLGLDVPA